MKASTPPQRPRDRFGKILAIVFVSFCFYNKTSFAQSKGCAVTDGVDWEAAFTACDAIIKAGSVPARELAVAHLNRGLVWNARAWHSQRQQGQTYWQYAIDDFTAAIRFDPTLAVAYSNRGSLWTTRHGFPQFGAPDPGDFDHSMADFTDAIRVDPKFSLAYLLRGGLWMERYAGASLYGGSVDNNDITRAIADYSAAIRIDPLSGTLSSAKATIATAANLNAYAGRAGAHNMWATLLVPDNKTGALDSYASAIADFGEAIRIEPKSPDNHDKRADVYSSRASLVHDMNPESADDAVIADYTAAIAELDEAIRLAPTGQRYAYRAQAYASRWDIRSTSGDSAAVKRDCAAAAASNPKGTSYICDKVEAR